MNWFVRFLLGYPARPTDIAALRRAFPELLDDGMHFDERRFVWFLCPGIDTQRGLADALRRWIGKEAVLNKNGGPSRQGCPFSGCPLPGSAVRSNQGSAQNSIEFLVASDGAVGKPPLGRFLDLVQRTHAKCGSVKEVILTDPYIYSDIGESGTGGGFSNLIAYLEALGLSKDDRFTLKLTPSPKKCGVDAKNSLHKNLSMKFTKIKIEHFASTLAFHDRFYVVRHGSGEIKGIFGPSLNALTSNDIVIMGDIDEIQPLKKLKEWFG